MKHKFITNGGGTYKVYGPTEVCRSLGMTGVRIGCRRSLEKAIKLRDEWFAKNKITHLLLEPEAPGSEVIDNPDGSKMINYTGRISTIEGLLEHCKIDREVWEVDDKPILNFWDVTTADGTTYQNFQIKIRLKKKFRELDEQHLIKLLEGMPKAVPHPAEYDYGDGDHLLEINIADLHFGRLCWRGETGEDFDMKIARERFITALSRLISLSYSFRLEKILFIMGNDFFQADNLIGETTAGTRQDMDGRYGKMYSEGVALIIEAIDILRMIAPVDVVSVTGNHEMQTGMCAAHCINLYYSEVPEVTVDWQPIARKYRQYGNSMLGLAHGHGVKKDQWFEVFASEAAEMWGRTTFRYLHLGHFHHNRCEEHKGLTIQYLGSLTGVDNWHSESGYVQTRKSASAFVYSRTGGMVSELICNLPVTTYPNTSNL